MYGIVFLMMVFSVGFVLVSTLFTLKYYNPRIRQFKDLFTGECGLSLILSSVLNANFSGYILHLYGYSMGGV
jgi:hypothetical protein